MRRRGVEGGFSAFLSSFLISLIADRSISDSREAITDLCCFTSSSKSSTSSTLSRHATVTSQSEAPAPPPPKTLRKRRRNSPCVPQMADNTERLHAQVATVRRAASPHINMTTEILEAVDLQNKSMRWCEWRRTWTCRRTILRTLIHPSITAISASWWHTAAFPLMLVLMLVYGLRPYTRQVGQSLKYKIINHDGFSDS